MESLPGGRNGEIFRDGGHALRPAGPWNPTVHSLLHHLRRRGFVEAPQPIGINEQGQEVVSFVEGRVGEDLADAVLGSEEALTSSARLLRRFHDASTDFLANVDEPSIWMLPSKHPSELVCHGDFAPYNVAFVNAEAVGIIDFDTAHPAPRVWDLAYAIYRWAPLSDPALSSTPFGTAVQIRRARLFCDAYGASHDERQQLPLMVGARLSGLVDFMLARARDGSPQFVEDVEQGHVQTYLRDIRYVRSLEIPLLSGLVERC